MENNTSRKGMMVKTRNLDNNPIPGVAEKHNRVRRNGVIGKLISPVGGLGGDVWFVEHERSGNVGAYCFCEYDEATPDEILRGSELCCDHWQTNLQIMMRKHEQSVACGKPEPFIPPKFCMNCGAAW